jgi:hypothetical protein
MPVMVEFGEEEVLIGENKVKKKPTLYLHTSLYSDAKVEYRFWLTLDVPFGVAK